MPATTSTTSARSAAWAFGVVVVLGAVTIRSIGSDLWFDIDEWGFLVDRSASPGDLLESWNQHWTTVPILAYRALWHLVGVNQYWPYQALTITSHLASACLLRVLMRRGGAHPWVATAAATLFVFLGSGNENLVRAFQFTFAGSLAFGLAHLVLADHDGGLDRRDAAGLACGLAGLMCSGIAVTMVFVVGLATLLRRGWRVAAAHTVPLTVAYVAWWAAYRGEAADAIPTPGPGDLLAFTLDLIGTSVAALGHVWGVGAVLGVLGVAGLVRRLQRDGIAAVRGELAAPLAAATGIVPLAVSIGWGRGGIFGGQPPIAPRYVHLVAAMVLPAVAIGLSELARRRPPLVVGAVALLLVGLPGNVGQIEPPAPVFLDLVSEELVLSVAEAAEDHPAPDEGHPLSAGGSFITVGWLREGRAEGSIPDAPASTPPAVRSRAELALTVMPVDDLGEGTCAPVPPDAIELRAGDRLRIEAPSTRIVRTEPAGPPASILLFAEGPELLVGAFDGPLTVRLDRPVPVERCR